MACCGVLSTFQKRRETLTELEKGEKKADVAQTTRATLPSSKHPTSPPCLSSADSKSSTTASLMPGSSVPASSAVI